MQENWFLVVHRNPLILQASARWNAMVDREPGLQRRVKLARVPTNHQTVPGRVNRRHDLEKSSMVFVAQLAFVDFSARSLAEDVGRIAENEGLCRCFFRRSRAADLCGAVLRRGITRHAIAIYPPFVAAGDARSTVGGSSVGVRCGGVLRTPERKPHPFYAVAVVDCDRTTFLCATPIPPPLANTWVLINHYGVFRWPDVSYHTAMPSKWNNQDPVGGNQIDQSLKDSSPRFAAGVAAFDALYRGG